MVQDGLEGLLRVATEYEGFGGWVVTLNKGEIGGNMDPEKGDNRERLLWDRIGSL